MKTVLLIALVFSCIYSLGVPSFKDDTLFGCLCPQNMTLLFNPTEDTLFIDSVGIRVDSGYASMAYKFQTVSRVVAPETTTYYPDSLYWIGLNGVPLIGFSLKILTVLPKDSLHIGNMWPQEPPMPTKSLAENRMAAIDTVDVAVMLYFAGNHKVVDSLYYKDVFIFYTSNAVENKAQSSMPLIKVQPNPALNNVSINTFGANPLEIQVFNVLGQCVYQNQKPGKASNVSLKGLSAGQYIVEVTTKRAALRQRITVQR